LLRCITSGLFHPEQAAAVSEYSGSLAAIRTENVYTPKVEQVERLMGALGIARPHQADSRTEPASTDEEITGYLEEAGDKVAKLVNKQQSYQHALETQRQTIRHLEHLNTLDVNFDDLFSCKYLKIRFGRLPVDSYNKLHFYDDKPFVYFSFDRDNDYYWSLYVTSARDEAEIDNLFTSLYFERLIIPAYAHGTPTKAIETINTHMAATQKAMEQTQTEMAAMAKTQGDALRRLWVDLKLLEHRSEIQLRAAELRHYAATGSGNFEVIGFVPLRRVEEFRKCFEGLEVKVSPKPADASASLTPPVKLRNSWLVRPFEMFVSMYGLPNYKDFDPTPVVAITYMLLFGIMFGDVGQGLAISLIGWLLWKFKKMPLGGVLERIGIFSAVFGLVYGSVFGFEHLLDPMYKALGFAEKPVEVMAPTTTNIILLAAVGIGVVIIVMAISLNIALGIKRRDWGRAFFSNNGLAGLVFYLAAIYAAVSSLALHKSVMTGPYKFFLIALPLIVMFLQQPLSKLAAGKKDLFEGGVGGFIVESFFEMFEVLLSFVTNTMSFLRVGGFVLSHAGMMAVVFTLSGMVSASASPAVIIIGNLFVMGLEGLIVGIQVLRLEFYEIFSRFFDGDGKPYVPVTDAADGGEALSAQAA